MFQHVIKLMETVKDLLSHCSLEAVPTCESLNRSGQNHYSRVEALEFSKYEAAIDIWHNQAAIAFQQNNQEQCEAALRRKWQYQRRLAAYQQTEVPEKPAKPEEIFKPRNNA